MGQILAVLGERLTPSLVVEMAIASHGLPNEWPAATLREAADVEPEVADAEIASEIYSTAGNYDLLAKFYVDDEEDVGHFVNEKVQHLPGIKDTFTVVTFRAF